MRSLLARLIDVHIAYQNSLQEIMLLGQLTALHPGVLGRIQIHNGIILLSIMYCIIIIIIESCSHSLFRDEHGFLDFGHFSSNAFCQFYETISFLCVHTEQTLAANCNYY